MLITSACSCNQQVCLHHCCSLSLVVNLRSKTTVVSALQNDTTFVFQYALQNDMTKVFGLCLSCLRHHLLARASLLAP